MQPILEVRDLTRKFKDLVAVDNISFSLKEGEILGLLGPNGAGKTTTLQMLLGVLNKTSGDISYFGKDLIKHREEILEQVNFSSTYTNLPWELDYFICRFRTQVFNIHQEESCEQLLITCPQHASKIYVENCRIDQRFKKVLDQSAGICFDVAHQVDLGIKQQMYDADAFVSKYLQKYTIGCCHVSAIGETPIQAYSILDDKHIDIYSWHSFNDLSQLDYVRDYVQYLPEYVSLELDNSFADQLRARQYLENIINS